MSIKKQIQQLEWVVEALERKLDEHIEEENTRNKRILENHLAILELKKELKNLPEFYVETTPEPEPEPVRRGYFWYKK